MKSRDLVITGAVNGFIVESFDGARVYESLDDVLRYMLLHYEGRSSTGYDEAYGVVKVIRERDPKPT